MQANLDGVVDSNDPVFDELQVWVDANGDGVSQTTELTKLAQQNITAVNYAGNTFTRSVAGTGANAGTVTLTTSLVASADLQAERDGTQQSLIAEGLLIQSSNGTLSLIVNNVQDLSGGGGGGGGTPGLDGLTGIEDAQLIVGAGDLTQNDTVGGFTANALTVTGVSNANHGTVTLVNGVVTFTPEANWFTTKQSYDANRQEVKDAAGNTIFTAVAGRAAGFDYTVAAPGGATATFHADVALKNVNDALVIVVGATGTDAAAERKPIRCLLLRRSREVASQRMRLTRAAGALCARDKKQKYRWLENGSHQRFYAYYDAISLVGAIITKFNFYKNSETRLSRATS